jgi:hypothetical protein
MARVHQSKNKQVKKPNTAQKNKPITKVEPPKISQKREPSKNEIILFRVGLAIIGITLVTLAIVFTIRHYMNKDETQGPLDEYMHIYVSELEVFARFIEDRGNYGDLSEFDGKSQYQELRDKLQGQDTIYFFFYRASNLNEDVKAALLKINDLKDKPILFINMDDRVFNETLFTSPLLTHLKLEENRDHMLLIYDIYAEKQFTLWVNTNIVILELAKL